MAAIAPSPAGTARCMSSPRRRTSRRASAKSRAPAATSAEYSPRLWPATATGAPGTAPSSASARWMASEQVRSAGWVLVVRARSSSGPSQHNRVSSSPSTSSASSKVRRAAAERSAQARPMPTCCDPCPG